jgi:hypothetical protein
MVTAASVSLLLSNAGMTVPSIVLTLPALPNPAYPNSCIVTLATNGQLYTNNNGVWKNTIASIPATGAGSINEILAAADLIIPAIVAALPSLPDSKYPNNSTVTFNGQLYVNNNGVWNNKVDVSQITGQLTADHIASVNAASISGNLSADMLSKIGSGITGLTASQISSINAAALSGVALNASNITSGTISTGLLSAAGIIAAVEQVGTLQAASWSANGIAALKIDGSQINAGTINTAQLAAGQIDADRLTAHSITANQIGANSVTANSILAGELKAKMIATDQITAGCIAAGAVGAAAISSTVAFVGQSLSIGANATFTSANWQPGTSSNAPVGFKMTGDKFTTTFIGGGTDTNCQMEIGADVNLAGAPAAQIATKATSPNVTTAHVTAYQVPNAGWYALGNNTYFTPKYSNAQILILVTGAVAGCNQANGCLVKLMYGTGTAPSQGPGYTGTELTQTSAVIGNGIMATFPICLQALLNIGTGGTTLWFDVFVWSPQTTGYIVTSNITVIQV